LILDFKTINHKFIKGILVSRTVVSGLILCTPIILGILGITLFSANKKG
jgi:hypothetical protein